MKTSIIAAAAVASLALAGCSKERSGTFTDDEGNVTEYTVDGDTENSTVKISSDDGDMTIEAGKDIAANLPDGVTTYPGAKILSSANMSNSEDRKGSSMVQMETPDSKDKIVKYYKDSFKAKGIDVETEITADKMSMMAGKAKDGTVVSVMVNEAGDDGNMIMLTTGKE
ncbi:hypothetical protein [Sphingorhabdus sp. Alg239-R122]|uniref:hypothetical protein n=1 Tax=Sphingorhabdus sp. Alg239-R122 TaxID=2305989 RepID=UPI0013DC8193|nr:hypothetical protein [Sphingorhabdus sp. Alg239-R122]